MNQEHYDAVVKFAQENGLYDELKKELDYLANFGGDPNYAECQLYKDFAPQSFAFDMLRNGKRWFNGGLIFHGPHDRGGDGGMPTLSVSLNPDTRPHWQVHT
jgi:hypothetical protein